MSNIKKLDYFNVVTGNIVDSKSYGIDITTFRKADNVDMIFDSRGSYLGIRTSRGKFIDHKGRKYYTTKKGPYDFKSFMDLNIWNDEYLNLLFQIGKLS